MERPENPPGGFTPERTSGFVSIARLRAPAQLVAERLVVTAASSFHQPEAHRGAADLNPLTNLERDDFLTVDDGDRAGGGLADGHRVHLVGRIDDRPVRERVR